MDIDPVLQRFLTYLDASPTPNHAVRTTVEVLDAHGFSEIDLGDPPEQLPAGFRGYLAKSGSLVAFHVGSKPAVETGFRMVSAHTDSPNLRIKPQPYVRSHGYVRLLVEVYGGPINPTWTDRDLGMAGIVAVRDGERIRQHLVTVHKPVCRIPNIAIHLNRTVNEEGLKVNAHTDLPAVFSLVDDGSEDPLRAILAAEIGVQAKDVLTWDLSLYDLTPARIIGAHDEFVCSARLDNLASCHAGLEALIASLWHGVPESTSILALFDHEEIGSQTARGANSRTLEEVLRMILRNAEPQGQGTFSRSLAHSWLVSADMAHAVHPARSEMHDGTHMPKMGAGPVIKQNANKRYGTDADTAAMFLLLCERAEVPVQWFVNRSDLACGSTVGPILASRLGVRTVDVGNAMLSMHSAREMCGTADHPRMAKVLTEFFRLPTIA
ncbi:MAG: M18 family aminopeptidase [Alphaproteobacteria bacterium]|nr:M18 family aminopeptidase [Alphaproteobacteria bacterium]